MFRQENRPVRTIHRPLALHSSTVATTYPTLSTLNLPLNCSNVFTAARFLNSKEAKLGNADKQLVATRWSR